MGSQTVKNWFGDTFYKLHPLLQQLHIDGGRLSGDVKIDYGAGLAGLLGRRLAIKMNLPGAGVHRLVVDIAHDSEGLHWGRSFNEQTLLYSLFKPVGKLGQGHWVEKTGPLKMELTVDVIDGGWHWRCLKVALHGLPIPQWLVPETRAYKLIENGEYRFFVGFSMPFIGTLVSYQGLLQADSSGT